MLTALSCMIVRIGRAPSSTLFPYTTLFRSLSLANGLPELVHALRQSCRSESLARHGPRVENGFAASHGEFSRYPSCRLGDRKSTRLNSSHLGISYAVFCLKKKTTNRERCME